ncbi:MAG: DNA polymerase I, partial [Vibrionaceae bacterium]
MTTSTDNPLILVDGSSYLYRAFHVAPPFTNAEGLPTGAIYVVINMLRSLINQYPTSDIAVIFDAKGKNFRHALFADYKAHRPAMPDELRVQIEPLHQIITAMGLTLLAIEGVEADDVIGTLAEQASRAGLPILISTGDKDMAQLVNKHVRLIDTMKNALLDEAGVVAKYGFAAHHFVDYLALIGDSSDNIPGVAGIGPKTAVTLINQFGSLDNIYANLDAVATLTGLRGAKSVHAKLLASKEMAYLSQKLATIKLDCELPLTAAQIKNHTGDHEQLISLFSQLNFKRWLDEAKNGGAGAQAVAQKQLEKIQAAPLQNASLDLAQTQIDRACYSTIFTLEELDNWINKLESASLVAFDTETDSLNYMQANLVGMSFAISESEVAYLPLAHDYIGAPLQLDRQLVLNKLRHWLEDPSKLKVGQNLKYDASVLARYNIALNGIAFDTMLESYVLNSVAGRHDMESLAQRYLQHECISFEAIAGKGKKQLTFNQIAIEEATAYAGEDADVTLRLHKTLFGLFAKTPSQLTVLTQIEIPLVPILSRMEGQGVLIDSHMLGEQSLQLATRLTQLEQEAFELAGETFNLNSPLQLQTILFEKMQLPVLKKTPSGKPSTDESVLQELALDYPLPARLLEYRSLAKLKSTYTDKLPMMVDPVTQRVHTSYHQALAVTGRLSSSEPNLQNIPIRTSEGRRIREAFIAAPGNSILAVDYSQIELRIMAHLSQDSSLIKAFLQGQDVHSATASEIMGLPIEEVTRDMRRNAKAINFGLIYGMSAFGLAKQ